MTCTPSANVTAPPSPTVATTATATITAVAEAAEVARGAVTAVVVAAGEIEVTEADEVGRGRPQLTMTTTAAAAAAKVGGAGTVVGAGAVPPAAAEGTTPAPPPLGVSPGGPNLTPTGLPTACSILNSWQLPYKLPEGRHS